VLSAQRSAALRAGKGPLDRAPDELTHYWKEVYSNPLVPSRGGVFPHGGEPELADGINAAGSRPTASRRTVGLDHRRREPGQLQIAYQRINVKPHVVAVLSQRGALNFFQPGTATVSTVF